MPYHCLSAKTGENIDELFHLVIDMLQIFYKFVSKSLSRELQNDL